MAAGASPRVLLLDVPLALLVTGASWFSLLAARLPDRGRRPGPDWGGRPPWQGPGEWPPVDVPWALGLLLLPLLAGLALRRLQPLPGFLAVAAATALLLAGDAPFWPLCLAPALALLALASSRPPGRWWPWALLLVPVLALGWFPFDADELSWTNLSATTLAVVVMAVAALAGLLTRARRLARERARREELRQSADAERLRIAREVHDLVGHSLSVITMQAGVALHVVNRRPEQAEESLRAIRQTGLEAMAELRSTLAVFRDGGGPTEPPAGLERLPALVEQLRAAGREVDLDLPDLGPLPPTVSHAVYRIVQESLTNVGRHAPGAAARVELRRTGRELQVAVRDRGPVRAGAPVAGHGIAGMAERARALGGTLEVGAPADGGVLVQARIPVEEGP